MKILRKTKTCKCVFNNGFEQKGMKLPKYNLGYNTRDQLRSLAISASERKHEIKFVKCHCLILSTNIRPLAIIPERAFLMLSLFSELKHFKISASF